MARNKNVNHRGREHQKGEEPEIIRAFEVHAHRLEFGNEETENRRDLISERDGEQPHRHEQTLHAIRRLGVGEFQAGN